MRGTLRTADVAMLLVEVGVVVHLDGPGFARVPGQVALTLENGQMGMHGGRRGQSHCFTDLAHGRGIAPVALAVGDEGEDLLPFSAQDFGHGFLLLPLRPTHPGGERSFVTGPR